MQFGFRISPPKMPMQWAGMGIHKNILRGSHKKYWEYPRWFSYSLWDMLIPWRVFLIFTCKFGLNGIQGFWLLILSPSDGVMIFTKQMSLPFFSFKGLTKTDVFFVWDRWCLASYVLCVVIILLLCTFVVCTKWFGLLVDTLWKWQDLFMVETSSKETRKDIKKGLK